MVVLEADEPMDHERMWTRAGSCSSLSNTIRSRKCIKPPSLLLCVKLQDVRPLPTPLSAIRSIATLSYIKMKFSLAALALCVAAFAGVLGQEDHPCVNACSHNTTSLGLCNQ